MITGLALAQTRDQYRQSATPRAGGRHHLACVPENGD